MGDGPRQLCAVAVENTLHSDDNAIMVSKKNVSVHFDMGFEDRARNSRRGMRGTIRLGALREG